MTGPSRDAAPTPRPHVAERRALRHLVLNELDDTSLDALCVGPAGAPLVGPSPSWHALASAVRTPARRPSTTLVTGPDALERAVVDVLRPLCDGVELWDGRSPRGAPDLLVGALPWRYEEIGDVPDLPGPLRGPSPAVLPLAFTARSVTVGPVAGAFADGPCLRCVHPAYADAATRPSAALAPSLFAFAAGASGLFMRSFAANNVVACSISLTFDLAAPHVEHRLWSCTPACRRAA